MKNHNNNNHVFEDFFKKSTDVGIPPEIELRLRERLVEFREKMEQYHLETRRASLFDIIGSISMTKTKLAIGTAVVAVLIVMGIYFRPWGENPQQKAYAAVAKKLNNAKTMTYATILKLEGAPELRAEHFYKDPGLLRMNMSGRKADSIIVNGYGVFDMTRKKGMLVMHSEKQYREFDLSKEAEIYKKRPEYNFIKHMQSLPMRADSFLGEHVINGRMLNGFVVHEDGIKKTVWTDVSTEELVKIDMKLQNMTGYEYFITDIRFDVALDDSLFNLNPPKEYRFMKEKSSDTKDKPNENDLLLFLNATASRHKETLFPSSMNDYAEFSKYLKELDKKRFQEEPIDEKTRGAVTRALVFVTKMKPENDWHYAGGDVKLGSADVPIAWWKPDSVETYRVIYGDLKIKDVKPEELKKPEFNRK